MTAGGEARPEGVHGLDLVLTAACNLRCSYCYQNDKQPKRMEWSTAAAALDLVLRSDRDEIVITFFGGEPLLEMDTIRRAVAYVRARLPAGKRVKFVMSTNGTLLDDATAAFLALHDFHTQLSFDGVPPAQAARGLHTWSRLDELLTRLGSEFPSWFRRSFDVAVTVHSGNVAHLFDSFAYLAGKRVATVKAGPLFTHDAGWTPAHRDLLDAQVRRVFDLSLRIYRETGRVPFEPFRKTERRRPAPRPRAMCGVGGGEVIAVDVDGQTTGCVTFAESYQKLPSDLLRGRLEAMRMGDVRSRDFPRRLALYPEAARAAGIFDDKQDKHSSYARCGECAYLATCSVCPTSIGHIPGNTDPTRVPDHQCAYHLVVQAHRARFPRQPTLSEKLSGRAGEPRLARARGRAASRKEA
jgi:sulfatase maturation enzyme AslB (radical SAM superfamily)